MSRIPIVIGVEDRDLVEDLRSGDFDRRAENVVEAGRQGAELLGHVVEVGEVDGCEGAVELLG